MPLLDVQDLRTHFHTRGGIYRAVDGVSFAVEPGETLGIVGESGSGKSVTCYSLLGLVPAPPGRIVGGRALFDGSDLLHCPPARLRALRGRRIAMIFQDPMTSLNPYLRVSDQLIEPLLIHEKISRRDALARGLAMLEAVGINDAARRLNSYPHEFSGGMRQRVMIAMALITRPELLIADEPTTALDVTVQAQILELLQRLQHEFGMAVIFITHDLGVVSGLCDRVQVMYAGRIVESAPTRTLFAAPRHPYTRALQRSIQRGRHSSPFPACRPTCRSPSPAVLSPAGVSSPPIAAAARRRRWPRSPAIRPTPTPACAPRRGSSEPSPVTMSLPVKNQTFFATDCRDEPHRIFLLIFLVLFSGTPPLCATILQRLPFSARSPCAARRVITASLLL